MSTDKHKKNRGNVQNLKPFKPGQSGNPKGRPRAQGIRAAVREAATDEKRVKIANRLLAIASWSETKITKNKTNAGLYKWAIDTIRDCFSDVIIPEAAEGKIKFTMDLSGGRSQHDD